MTQCYQLVSDHEAESALLGILLNDSIARDEYLYTLPEGMFTDPVLIGIFRALKVCSRGNYEILPKVVTEIALREGPSQEVTPKDVNRLMLKNAGLKPKYFFDLCRVAYIRRELITRMTHLIKEASETDDVFECQQKTIDAICSISPEHVTSSSRTISQIGRDFTEDGKNFLEYIDSKILAGPFIASLDGPSTGFEALDGMIRGLVPGRMIILAGYTGSGKTETACQILSRVVDSGIHVLMFSMEMSEQEVYTRLAGIKCGIFHSDLKAGHVTPEERERVDYVYHDFDKRRHNLHVIKTTDMTTDAIKREIVRHKQKYGIQVVVLDHLGLVRPAKNERLNGTYEKSSFVSREIKTFSSDLGVCMLVLAQFSRPDKNAEINRVPRASDLRDSGCIEQDADQIMLIHREKDSNGMYKDNQVMWLVVKNRHGDVGTIRMIFDRKTQRFNDYIPEPINFGHPPDNPYLYLEAKK